MIPLPAKRGQTTQSVDRALTLFNYIVARPREEHSLKSLSLLLDIDKSSTFRLLRTLVHHGMLRQEKHHYRLGSALYRIVGALEKQERLLLTNLRPMLHQLVQLTDEAAHAAVREGDQALFIACETGSHRISSTTVVGDKEELYCTAVGRSLISHFTLEELQQCLGSTTLRAFTSRTTTNLASIYQQLQQVRQEGIAFDDGEYEEGVYCLAAPIYNHRGEAVAALGLSGLRHRLEPNHLHYAQLLLSYARQLSSEFGYQDSTASQH